MGKYEARTAIKLELRNEAVIRWVDLSRRLTKFIPSPGDNLHAEKISNWRVIFSDDRSDDQYLSDIDFGERE